MNDQSSRNRVISDQESEHITRLEELAYEVKVQEAMTADAKALDASQTMKEALDLFRTLRISGAPVLQHGDIVGVLSIEDVIRALMVPDLEAKVTEYMTSKVMTIRDEELVVEALKIFVNKPIGRLPVVD